jgi:hypothetical protein
MASDIEEGGRRNGEVLLAAKANNRPLEFIDLIIISNLTIFTFMSYLVFAIFQFFLHGQLLEID